MASLSRSVIISGEAPETDSEEETTSHPSSPVKSINPIQGAVITGEDSESENENDASVSSAASVLDQSHNTQKETESNESRHSTLLHQKLRESNAQLASDTEAYCDTIVNEAGKTLSVIDQQLLKSQIVLQGALSSMRSLSANSFLVKDKLHSLLSSKFLSNVKVEQK